jgi:excisionase family DNA binding protein
MNNISEIQNKPYLSTREAAKLLNLSRAKVGQLISEGELAGVLAGNKYVISRESLDSYVKGERYK